MSPWKPVLTGGRVYDDQTWLDRLDAEFAKQEGMDYQEILSLLIPRWKLIRPALGAVEAQERAMA